MQLGKFVAPMLLDEIEQPFNSKDYIYELKFDGVRTILHTGKNTFKLFGRRKTDFTNLYPELKEIQKSIKHDCIFDGEIVTFVKGVPSFLKLQERTHAKKKEKIKSLVEQVPVVFMVFDILYLDGVDLTNKSLMERKKLLDSFSDTETFIKVKYVEEKGKELFKKVKKMNFEGIVAKKKDSVYEIGERVESWIKIKNLKEEKFFVGGYFEKNENAVISLYLGEYRKNKFCFVGKVSMGKKQKLYEVIKNANVIKKSPFVDFEEKECKYIKPTIEVTIAYLERTNTNHLRQPIFKK